MNMDINEKEIEKASRKIDLSGFKMQDELNPKIWDKEQKMKPEVRKTLLKIADDYFESLDLPGVDIEDVTMTGSLANYNWSKYSDVDLHIVVDYSEIPVDEDLVQDFLKSKSSNWNKEHDVKVYGYDVELYVQDINEPHHSTGVYSILNNEWNIEPEKKKISFNDKSVKDKANRLMDRVEEIYDEMDEVDNNETVKRVDKLTEKIKKMRQSGLESGGEFSVENIVFKVLRRNGMLDRLYDIKTVAYDKSVTLESSELNKLTESMVGDDLDWIRDTGLPFRVGDVFHTRLDFTPKDLNAEITFEIYDISPDGKRVRFAHHKGSTYKGTYIDIDKINSETISRGWDKVGYNGANSTESNQVIKNITNGFWKKVEVPGYLDLHPEKKDEIIQLGTNMNESNDFDWISDINPTPIEKDEDWRSSHGAEYQIVLDYFNKQRVQQEGEWKYAIDSLSGSVEWWTEDREIIFWATPFWDGMEDLPIQYQADMGDYGDVVIIELPKFHYKEELINWLENEYPQIVYKEITEFIDYNGPLAESVNEKFSDKLKNMKPKEEVEKIKNGFKKFREGLKQEGKETKEAWNIVTKAIKEKRKLTEEEEKKVKNQLGDLFKTTGLTLATFLPGGTLYLLLTTVPRFKKYLLPSAFNKESEEFKVK